MGHRGYVGQSQGPRLSGAVGWNTVVSPVGTSDYTVGQRRHSHV